MKTIKDKELLVAADIAGFELKEAIVKHLEAKGWKITDIGVRSADDPHPEMFHRIGLQVGAKIAERAKEKGIETVVFDRGGYIYHGRVSELASGAREGGLKF